MRKASKAFIARLPMKPQVEAEAVWLSSLQAVEQAALLTRLAHGLTIGVRVLCHTEQSASNIESIRLLNEGLHKVLGYLLSSPGTILSEASLVIVVNSVLGIEDEVANEQASQAWSYARNTRAC